MAPEAPTELPEDITDDLAELSTEELLELARFAEELANARRESDLEVESPRRSDHQADTGTDRAQEDHRQETETLPEDVPSKASITIKEINDNRYYYWQWRDGDQIRSKYKGPVDGSE